MKRIKSTIFHIPVIFQEEPEGGFTVIVPSLSGCITYGKNLFEARKMAKEAIELYLEDMIAEGEAIPDFAAAYLGEVQVALPKERAVLHG